MLLSPINLLLLKIRSIRLTSALLPDILCQTRFALGHALICLRFFSCIRIHLFHGGSEHGNSLVYIKKDGIERERERLGGERGERERERDREREPCHARVTSLVSLIPVAFFLSPSNAGNSGH